MEPWVKRWHYFFLIANILLFGYACYDLVLDIRILHIGVSYYTALLFLGSGIGIGGYTEALMRGESKVIRYAFVCYGCYFI